MKKGKVIGIILGVWFLAGAAVSSTTTTKKAIAHDDAVNKKAVVKKAVAASKPDGAQAFVDEYEGQFDGLYLFAQKGKIVVAGWEGMGIIELIDREDQIKTLYDYFNMDKKYADVTVELGHE
jgi:flavodoxin